MRVFHAVTGMFIVGACGDAVRKKVAPSKRRGPASGEGHPALASLQQAVRQDLYTCSYTHGILMHKFIFMMNRYKSTQVNSLSRTCLYASVQVNTHAIYVLYIYIYI